MADECVIESNRRDLFARNGKEVKQVRHQNNPCGISGRDGHGLFFCVAEKFCNQRSAVMTKQEMIFHCG